MAPDIESTSGINYTSQELRHLRLVDFTKQFLLMVNDTKVLRVEQQGMHFSWLTIQYVFVLHFLGNMKFVAEYKKMACLSGMEPRTSG